MQVLNFNSQESINSFLFLTFIYFYFLYKKYYNNIIVLLILKMSGEGLGVQVAIDSRLIVENPVQIITTGAAQNLHQYVQATTVSGSQLLWNNILSIGNNVLIDPNWFVEYDVAISYNTTATNGGNGAAGTIPIILPNVDTTTVADPVINASPFSVPTAATSPNVVFSQFPLTRATNTISLQFNNVETSVNANQLLNICREWILDADKKRELASSCPTYNYVSPNTVLSSATLIVPNQPTTPYCASAGYSRASFIPKSVSVSGAIATVIYTLREPVFISPLTLSNSAGFGQVQSINLRYNLDNSKSLAAMLQTPYAFFTGADGSRVAANPSCTIVAASLYLDYLTVDTLKTGVLPPICYYNFEFPDFQQTALSGLNNTPALNTVYQMTTQSQKLSTMPKYYYCKLSPNFQGITSQNNTCGFPIRLMNITFGSFGQFIFDRQQLWQCFKKNTGKLDITFPQWVALGTPVVLQPAVDLTSASDAFQGKTNDSGIMWKNNISYDMDNYVAAGGGNLLANLGVDVNNCFAYEAFINAGSCQIGMGTCIFKNTTASEAEFSVALKDKDMVSADALSASQGVEGGSFLSGLKGVLHTAKKVAGMGARALQNPLAQKGLEYLASQGSGMSAGALSHSLRRRK